MTTPAPLPFYFGPAGAECFGWLHAPRAEVRSGMGLVICSPFGHEDRAAHRGLRQLAIVAADAGIATLRFDYLGTGDSAGADTEHDHPSAWVRSVHAAIDALRARSGVARICLLGARLGALAAALSASERDDVCALVALAPVVRGRGFLREAMLRSALAPVDTQADFELAGDVLSARARAELETIDLLDLPRPPAADVLLIDADSLYAGERWATRLTGQGVGTETFAASALSDLLEGVGDDGVPHALVARIAGWIGERAKSIRATPAMPPPPRPAPASNASTLRLGSVRESPLTLHAGATPLFAILSEPVSGPVRRTVLLLNTGSARRVGPSRLHVEWARRWAEAGIAVLRLDLPGLGDSGVQPGETEGEVYAIETGRAVGAAVAMLRARFGAVDCQLTGICSGAYHAYRAALSGADVQSLVLINQAAYHWHAGMTLSRSSLVLRLAGVLNEKDRLGAFPARGTAMQRALHHLKWRALWAGWAAWGEVRDAAHAVRLPLAGDVGAALQAIARRGVAIHVIVADDDGASQLLRLHARRTVVALQRRGALQLDVIADADHIFMSRASRARLRAVIDPIAHGRVPRSPSGHTRPTAALTAVTGASEHQESWAGSSEG